jgi:hypothetical protein
MFERGYMGRYKRFTVFLILLLLLSTVVAAAHHHDNTADDHDCPICFANHHHHATSHSATGLDLAPCFTKTRVVISSPSFIDKLFFFSRNSRGPPA